MNLKDLTQEVNSALDYNPDLSAYKDQVARVLNRHYLQISSQYPWLFRQKTSKLTLRADITGAATTNQLRVGTDSRNYDASNVVRFDGTAQSLPTREMLGKTLVVGDTDSPTSTSRASYAHGSSEREFTITGIFDVSADRHDYGGGPGASGGATAGARYGGTDSDEWPDGYQPAGFGGIVLDRPIVDPTTVTVAATPSSLAAISADYYTDWKIEFRQYYLPPDCIEVLGMMDRGLKTPVHGETYDSDTDTSSIGTSVNTAPSRGRIIFVDSSKEEHLFLDRDNSGDPIVAVEGMAVHTEAPMVPPVVESFTGTVWKDSSHADTTEHPWLFGGDTYEYCYTFVYAGVESPPSPVTKVIMGDDSDYYGTKLEFQSVEGSFRRKGTYGPTDTPWSRSVRDEANADQKHRMTGRVIRVYRRKSQEPNDATSTNSQGYQRWIHIGDHFTDTPAWDSGKKQRSFADEGDTAIGFPDEYGYGSSQAVLGWPEAFWMRTGAWTYHDGELSKLRVLDESGPSQTIRVYRPPSSDMDIEIRYLSRPKRLVADADTPEWPVQYHHLLVYAALSDICMQHGITSQSQLYERKAEDLLDRMRQKYLARTNRKYIRGSFDRTVFAGERWGTPSKIG